MNTQLDSEIAVCVKQPHTHFQKIGNFWYYFRAEGHMQLANSDQTKIIENMHVKGLLKEIAPQNFKLKK
jgi:hypothetical protein